MIGNHKTEQRKQHSYMKPLAALALSVTLLQSALAVPVSAQGALSNNRISLTVDGAAASWQAAPFVRNGVTFVPLREAAAALGASVKWNQAARTVTLSTSQATVVHVSGTSSLKADGFSLQMPASSLTVNGTLMVPLRPLAEAFQASLAVTGAPSAMSIAIQTNQHDSYVADSLAAVDQYLQKVSFSGIALVAQDGEVMLRKGYGLAGGGKLNNADRTTRIASLTKAFTAAAVLKLAEQGKLSLTDPVSKYITGIPQGDRITIHMLLSHTSGLPANFARKEGDSLEQTVAQIRTMELKAEPGSTFIYSNCGYVLLAAIVEKLSGMAYGDYLEKTIFQPLGMTNTGTANKSTPTIKGYVKDGNGWKEAGYYVSQSGTGSLYSTVDDLLKWDQALYTNQILSESSLQKMFESYSSKSYGYGWNILLTGDDKTVYHVGSGSGYSTGMLRDLNSRTTVILLGNQYGLDITSYLTDIQKLTETALDKNT